VRYHYPLAAVVSPRSERQHRVLIGAAGSGTSWGVLMSLKETYADTNIVGASVEPRHLVAASAVCDRYEQLPRFDETDEFVAALLALLADAAIDTYVPVHDVEIVIAARLQAAGLLGSIACSAPQLRSAELCLDKLAMADWLAEQDVATPQTLLIDELDQIGRGWIVKPRHGVGSVGIDVVETKEALARWQSRPDRADYVAQQLLRGPELTLDAFRSREGTGRAVCRERVEVRSGVCTKARVFEDSELERLACELGTELELRGAYCLQVMSNHPNGPWQVTDVNPRPGAGTRMAVAVGVNVHAATFADLWGFDPEQYLPRLDGDKWVARQYQEAVLG
jgi:predicted ATP-grasp superfamily ATP-dependent carboligase